MTDTLKPNRARNRIQHWFRLEDYDQYVSQGKSMLDRELQRLGMTEFII